jgi:hypothetical protein
MDGFDFEASDAIFNDAKDNEEEKIEGNFISKNTHFWETAGNKVWEGEV